MTRQKSAPAARRFRGWAAVAVLVALGSSSAPDAPVADAAERGDLDAVRALLREGADVNASQGDGMSALHWSAMNDDRAMIEVLVYAGATPEAATRLGGYTPLHLASHRGFSNAVDALLDAGADPNGRTATGVAALHLAAESGDEATVTALVEHGADVNLRDTYQGRTPLMFAASLGRMAAIRALVASGADVAVTTDVVDFGVRAEADEEARQQRLRIQLALRGEEPEAEERRGAQGGRSPEEPDRPAGNAAQPEDVKAAAEEKAVAVAPDDPDRPTDPATQDPADPRAYQGNDSTGVFPSAQSYEELVGKQGGISALHYAARDGRMEAARALLDAGADVDQPSDGDRTTPLLMALINGNYDLAMMLLDRGADVNLVSEDGVGPLFGVLNNRWALRTWYPQPTAWQQQDADYMEVLGALLDGGADPNARVHTHVWYTAYNAGRMGVDFGGATPFWRAAYSLDVDAMKLLVAHGADPNVPTRKPESRRRGRGGPDGEEEADPSGLPPVPVGGPAVHPLHAATGVGYGTSRVGQQHRFVPDGWLPAVRYLVGELGLDVNVRDHEGFAPLHNAAARGDNEVLRYLVEQGADVTVVSRRGQTTVDMANGPQQRVQPFPETIAILEKLGAVNNHNCQSS